MSKECRTNTSLYIVKRILTGHQYLYCQKNSNGHQYLDCQKMAVHSIADTDTDMIVWKQFGLTMFHCHKQLFKWEVESKLIAFVTGHSRTRELYFQTKYLNKGNLSFHPTIRYLIVFCFHVMFMVLDMFMVLVFRYLLSSKEQQETSSFEVFPWFAPMRNSS